MIYIFEILALNCLIIIGLFEAMFYRPVRTNWDIKDCKIIEEYEARDKMFLWFIPYTLRKILPEFWLKPIATCVICMASLHSTYVYWFFFEFNLHNVLQYLIYIPALAGLNAIVMAFYDKA